MRTTADLYDEFGEDLQCCATQLRQYGGRRCFGGSAVTLRGHEDNALLASMVREPGRGRVLIIDGSGSLHCAMLGDKNATIAASNGWEGFIVHGAVRDSALLASIDIGVLALGSTPRKSKKDGACTADVVVSFGGAVFTPGAHVVADDDGVVVVPSVS